MRPLSITKLFGLDRPTIMRCLPSSIYGICRTEMLPEVPAVPVAQLHLANGCNNNSSNLHRKPPKHLRNQVNNHPSELRLLVQTPSRERQGIHFSLFLEEISRG